MAQLKDTEINGNLYVDGDIQIGDTDVMSTIEELKSNCGHIMAAISSNITLTTSAANISLSSVIESSGDFFQLTSDGNIKVLKDCVATINAQIYTLTGYTADDILHILIYKNGGVICRGIIRAINSASYTTLSANCTKVLSAGDTISFGTYNQTGARGTISSSSHFTNFSITGIGVL